MTRNGVYMAHRATNGTSRCSPFYPEWAYSAAQGLLDRKDGIRPAGHAGGRRRPEGTPITDLGGGGVCWKFVLNLVPSSS
jgi:hypothetical protein